MKKRKLIGNMTIICPKCGNHFSVTITDAVDEHGEVFICPNCRYLLRYTLK